MPRGIRLLDGNEIVADWVILAAGVYGSPTLLLRSGIGPASHLRDLGIKVLVDYRGSDEPRRPPEHRPRFPAGEGRA